MVFQDAFFDAREIQLDNPLQHFLADRVIGHHDQPVEQRIGKNFGEGYAHRFLEALGAGHQFGIFAQVDDDFLGRIAGEDDDGVFEIDITALGIFHPSLVENLEEDLVHVMMRLLDFVEQHDAVGAAADRFGEDAAFAVTDVAGRRAFKRAHSMCFLKFAHIDRD